MNVEPRWFTNLARLRTHETVDECPQRSGQAVRRGRTGLLQPDDASAVAPAGDATGATAATHEQRKARRWCSSRTRVHASVADSAAMATSSESSIWKGESGRDVVRPRSAASEPSRTRRGYQEGGQTQDFPITGSRP